MTRKTRRLTLIISAFCVLAIAVGLILFALRGTITYFYSPSEVSARPQLVGSRMRVGGLVKEGSVRRDVDQRIEFVITDTASDIKVTYQGLVPDLFREGKGVIAEGALVAPDRFSADSVLAKHDENYMPREVADALKKQGVWQDGKAN